MILSSVKKAFQVLEIFTPDYPELGVTEISNKLKLDKSSISRILSTLTSAGFLEKNPFNRKYRLGWKLVDLGNRVVNRYNDVRDCASPFMEDLAQKIKEIVHLSILDKNEIVYLEKKGEGQPLTVATKVGGRNPAYSSAMGKVLLAGLSQKELSDVLAMGPLIRSTPNTITEIPKLKNELEKVRKQGYAIDNEESFIGIKCVAAPIKDTKGKVIAAISASVPTQRMGRERLKEIRAYVLETAYRISQQIKVMG
jgi:IclR family KDG regulon transcriptional repressor